MSDPAKAWSKGAVAYRRMVKGAPGTVEAHHFFARDVAAHLKQRNLSGGYRVLDVASGHGEPGLSVLQEVPSVQLTVTDVAPYSKADRHEAGIILKSLAGCMFKAANGEDLSAWPDNTFDAVICSFALFMMNHERALVEWKRVLKPQGLVAFSTWDIKERHQLVALMGALIQKMTPGAPPAMPLVDLGKAEPVLAILQQLGFQEGNCRELNIPLYVAKENIGDLLENPMADAWIQRSAPAGREQEEFAANALQNMVAMAKERSFIQEDGSFLSPQQVMLYFTAVKP